VQARAASVYLIEASFLDTEMGIQYNRVYKSKRGFSRSVNNSRYRLLNAVEFPSCKIIKPDNVQHFLKTHSKEGNRHAI
jgi:hypothetical protein